jgi:GT2 family glycosyltransferase
VRKPLAYAEHTRQAAEQGGSASDGDAWIVFIRAGENLGFAGANNVGIRYVMARGETGYVWFLNNDTVVAPDALRRLVEVAERDPATGVVGALLFHYGAPDVVQAAGGGRITRWNGMPWPVIGGGAEKGAHGPDERFDYVHGASMLIPLAALRQVGLFDERYFLYSEEADWCFRMKAEGLRLGYAPAAMVWHKEGQTTGRRSPLQDYYVVRNTLFLVHRFFRPFVVPALLYSIYRCFLPKLLRGQWGRLTAVARAYRDFIRELARGTAGPRVPASPARRRRSGERRAS